MVLPAVSFSFRTFVLVSFCMAVPMVQAASFDCAKAGTEVEKLICTDKELSSLDDGLAASYQRARETSNDKATLQRKQVEWLKGRNSCKDKACLKQAYESRIATLDTASTSVKGKSDSDMSSQDAGKYRFELLKGAGTPVCYAYLQRLNTTSFEKPPYCGRPEETRVPGFTPLKRAPLTAEEVYVLSDRVGKFMFSGHQDSSQNIDNKERNDTRDNAKWLRWHIDTIGDIAVWRYVPPININNDGAPDSIIVWHGLGASTGTGVCGEMPGRPGFTRPIRQSQVSYFVDPSGKRIDEERTRSVFGHPSGGYRLTDNTLSHQFRPVGEAISIFKYQDLYYFDTFFDQWGDFEGKRKDEKGLENILGVFLHQKGKTRQVCEYRMTETEMK